MKNPFNNTAKVSNKTDLIIAEAESKLADNKVKKNCRLISFGLLAKAGISTEDNRLAAIFSDGHQQNIVNAVSSWIYHLNPKQNTAGIDDVKKYFTLFVNYLSENGIEYSW